ncbi:hypothetical protein GGR53DRAFT_505955 [Hypoxylon sp. FL1150]|nr:hypothetical protein GGR53DRAFT_505955 [Hypoxylon sp. FL1150]
MVPIRRQPGPKRMDDIRDLLEWHLSKKNRMFGGYAIGNCDDEGQTWTTVAISLDRKTNESEVAHMLNRLENDINQLLTPDQTPERLAFCVEDDSNDMYWAKSRSVRGTLNAKAATQQMEIEPNIESEDGEKTRPSTPQPETVKNMIEVRL